MSEFSKAKSLRIGCLDCPRPRRLDLPTLPPELDLRGANVPIFVVRTLNTITGHNSSKENIPLRERLDPLNNSVCDGPCDQKCIRTKEIDKFVDEIKNGHI